MSAPGPASVVLGNICLRPRGPGATVATVATLCNNWIRAPKCNGPSPFQSVDCRVRMADPPEAAPVVEQPSTQATAGEVP
jgi:hypothetical protein